MGETSLPIVDSENSVPEQKSSISKRVVESMTLLKPVLQKGIKSLPYFCAFSTFGYFYSISPVTLTLMQRKFGVSEGEISLIFATRGIGIMFGAFLSGPIYKAIESYNTKTSHDDDEKIYHITINKIVLVNILIISICVTLNGFIPYLFISLLLHLFIGISSGFLEIGCLTGLNNIWGKNINFVTQAMLMIYGLTSAIFPLIMSQIYSYIYDWEKQLAISYVICGVLVYCPSLILLGLFRTPKPLHGKKNEKSTKKKKDVNGKQSNINVPMKKEKNVKESLRLLIIKSWKFICGNEFWIFFLCSLLKLFFVGAVNAFSSLLFQYVVRIGLDTESNCSILSSLFYVGYTFGRFFSIFIVLCLPSFVTLLISFIGATVFMLLMFYPIFPILIWIYVIIIALFSAPAVASIYSLPLSFGYKFNPVKSSFMLIFQYFGENGFPLLFSYLSVDDVLGPHGMIYMSFGAFCVSLILLVIVAIIGYSHKWKNKKKNEEVGKEEKKSPREEGNEDKKIDGQ